MVFLKGVDGQIYVIVQGNIVVGGVGGLVVGSSIVINQLLVGCILGGVIVEWVVFSFFGGGDMVMLELNDNDFLIVSWVVDVLNKCFGSDIVVVQDGCVIWVCVLIFSGDCVVFFGVFENVDVIFGKLVVKVILNVCIGLVVMNQSVMFDICVVLYGNLLVVIQVDNVVSQFNVLVGGQIVGVQNVQVLINKELGKVMLLKGGVLLFDVVKVFNVIGVMLQDLLVILQVMKVVGLLCVEFEVI